MLLPGLPLLPDQPTGDGSGHVSQKRSTRLSELPGPGHSPMAGGPRRSSFWATKRGEIYSAVIGVCVCVCVRDAVQTLHGNVDVTDGTTLLSIVLRVALLGHRGEGGREGGRERGVKKSHFIFISIFPSWATQKKKGAIQLSPANLRQTETACCYHAYLHAVL